MGADPGAPVNSLRSPAPALARWEDLPTESARATARPPPMLMSASPRAHLATALRAPPFMLMSGRLSHKAARRDDAAGSGALCEGGGLRQTAAP